MAIQSRITAAFCGPEALGAKTSGLLEGDFFAQTNENINLFRLRHAFIKLKWEKTELLTGQYWNPMFVTECYPGTVSFSAGAPIQGLARNPQIRLSHQISNVKLTAAALGQRDFVDNGPEGRSSIYLRNAGIPEVQVQAQLALKGLLIGGGMGYKTIVPRLSADHNQKTYKVDESVTSVSALAFAKITTKPVTLKFQAKYGENNLDMLAPSGYAVRSVVDQETGEQAYTPLTNVSFWSEIHTNGQKFQAGVFAGVLKNRGTKKK
ncbi:MAG: hypothetical protein HC819_10895 [Cyclobacteriaceae bacterium]|nr:hypothetical protein [Cyclobacteriaceae bacterium]